MAFQAQYQAFVRFAVKAAQLSKAIALNQDLRFGTFHSGRALALRTLASTRSIYGASNPGPMLWPEGNRSRRIFQVVFLHYSWALWGQFSPRQGSPDASQIGFGRPLER